MDIGLVDDVVFFLAGKFIEYVLDNFEFSDFLVDIVESNEVVVVFVFMEIKKQEE